MKSISSILLAVILLLSCKQKDKHLDPSKQVDEGAVKGETYVSKDIGWTIVIPNGWTVVSRDQTAVNEERGKEALKKVTKSDIDVSGLKHLISFQKNRFNIFLSTSQPFPDENPQVYEENFAYTSKVIYDAYTSQGIRADTTMGKELIHGRKFDVFHARLYTKEGKLFLEQTIYSKLINKKDFAVTLSYNNEEDRKAMMYAFMNSSFKED